MKPALPAAAPLSKPLPTRDLVCVEDFAKEALFAKNPTDLGTRCTVFMNSNVKQAQKEGASVADISAGLAYSVIKNALFKVIKITKASDLGSHVVVQGGTFYNDAVLRSFEKISGCNAVRPRYRRDHVGGLRGRPHCQRALPHDPRGEDRTTSMLSLDKIVDLKYTTSMTRCKGCNNHCVLTINRFGSGGRHFISGNRCERGLGIEKSKKEVPTSLTINTTGCLTMIPCRRTRRTAASSASQES